MEPTRDPEGIEIDVLRKTGSLYGRSVLEIGCGNGRLIWRYAEGARKVTGVDPEGEKLADITGSRPENVTTPLVLAQAEAEDLPFPDETFESTIFGWSL